MLLFHILKSILYWLKSVFYLFFWSKAVNIMQKGDHLTEKGFKEILSLRASINKGLPGKIAVAFPGIIPYVKEDLEPVKTISDPNWLIGFITGEGCFTASLYNEEKKGI